MFIQTELLAFPWVDCYIRSNKPISMATPKNNSKEVGLEEQLWKAADKLRKNIDAAEYKHVVLGLIFLKYISDSFEELYYKLQAGEGEYAGPR